MLYEPKTITRSNKLKNNANKAKSPIEDIADDCREYYNYIFTYGERNIKIIEEYFCNNLTMSKLRDKYTKKEIIKETITKVKKSGKKSKSNTKLTVEITPRVKTKEIERVKEYFDEDITTSSLSVKIDIRCFNKDNGFCVGCIFFSFS
jgi:hypothetical protein